jgi:hypothetical protein
MPPRPHGRIWDVLVADLHTAHKPASCDARDSHGFDAVTSTRKMPHGSERVIAVVEEGEGQQRCRPFTSRDPRGQHQPHRVHKKDGIVRHSWEVFKASRRRACCYTSSEALLAPHTMRFFLASLVLALTLVQTSGECGDVNEISKVPCSMSTIFTDDQGYIQPAGLCNVDKCVPHLCITHADCPRTSRFVQEFPTKKHV